MSLELALAVVVGVSVLGNRLFSLLAGLVLKIPPTMLLPTLYAVDVVQIPFYYWVYESGSTLVNYFPARLRSWFGTGSRSAAGRWTASLGGLGVFVVATLPTFGGGMWSAVFLAYGLRLRKTWSYLLLASGSLLSYICLYWILSSVIQTVRYFAS